MCDPAYLERIPLVFRKQSTKGFITPAYYLRGTITEVVVHLQILIRGAGALVGGAKKLNAATIAITRDQMIENPASYFDH